MCARLRESMEQAIKEKAKDTIDRLIPKALGCRTCGYLFYIETPWLTALSLKIRVEFHELHSFVMFGEHCTEDLEPLYAAIQ